jgi:hypothetical protein
MKFSEGNLYPVYCFMCMFLHKSLYPPHGKLTMIFIDGLSNVQGSLLPKTRAVQNMASRESIFVGSVEDVLNSSILE